MAEDERPELPAKPRRPHISLQIPPYTPGPTSLSPGSRPSSLFYTGPLTPTTVDPSQGGYNVFVMNSGKAGNFVSKQFVSFRDFTLKSAKSGLSVGEKASVWMYGKIWALSRKWVTHMFLFLVVAAYSLLGGFLFYEIEGSAEKRAVIDIVENRRNVLLEIKQLYLEMKPFETETDELLWLGRSTHALQKYESVLLEYFKQDTHIMSKGDKPMWDFWSSVFYCGTIFTTIELLFGISTYQFNSITQQLISQTTISWHTLIEWEKLAQYS